VIPSVAQDTDLDALYEQVGRAITQKLPDDVREAVRPFFTSYRRYRLAGSSGGTAATASLAEALSAYPAAREAVDAIGAQVSAPDDTPDTLPASDVKPIDESRAQQDEAPASSMPVHPAAAIFPMMSKQDLQALADNIKEYGLREAIVVLDGKIVDGRNREAACVLAGIAPLYREWDGEGSVVAWILSVNLHRRHLTDTQRAMIGARAREAFAVEAEERRNAKLAQNKGSTVSADLRYRELSRSEEGKSAEVAAAQLQVSTRAVEQAAKVIGKGDESLVEAVTNGKVSLDAAAAVAALPREEQKKLVEKGEVKAKASEMRKTKKQTRNAAKKSSEAPPGPQRGGAAHDDSATGGQSTDVVSPEANEAGADDSQSPTTEADDNSPSAHDVRAEAPERTDARRDSIEAALRSLVAASRTIAGLVPERSWKSTLEELEELLGLVMLVGREAPEDDDEHIRFYVDSLMSEPTVRAPAHGKLPQA
jgi:ParB-like chromosome segregation protein Spo0J